MKLNQNELTKHLQKSFSPIYIISGDEPLISHETKDEIIRYAKSIGFMEHQRYQVDKHFDWQDFSMHANNLSLFSQKILIELNFSANHFNAKNTAVLQSYAENPVADNCVIISCPKLETKITKTKWFSKFEKNAVFIQIWPIEKQHLAAFIKQRLQQADLQAEDDVIKLLEENYEGNLLALKQVIDKLSLLYPNQKLSYENVKKSIINDTRFNLFELSDAMLMGNRQRTLQVMRVLKQEGIETILVLWLIAREIRLLANIANLQHNHNSIDTVLRQQGVFAKRVPLIKAALKRRNGDKWQKLLVYCNEIDLMIKGIRKGLVWDALERLALRVC